MKIIDRLKVWTEQLKKETFALYFAYRDPRVPWYAKALAAFVVAHTLSPIDLIPDFIPVLGYLDDLIITPLGLALAIKLIPVEVLAEARLKAETQLVDGTKLNQAGRIIVISIWLISMVMIGIVLWGLIAKTT